MISTTIWFLVAGREEATGYYIVAWVHVAVVIVTIIAAYPPYKELIQGFRSDDDDEQFPEFK